MDYEMAVIGTSAFVSGFELVGIKKVYGWDDLSKSKQEINRVVEDLLLSQDVGIVIMEEEAFMMLKEVNKDKVIISPKPIFFILSREKEEDESLRLMMKRALGTDLILK